MGGLKVVCTKSVLSVVLKGGLRVVLRVVFEKKTDALVNCEQTPEHFLELRFRKKLT